MSRIFAVTIQEVAAACAFDGRPTYVPGQFIVSEEAAGAILATIAEDVQIYRLEDGKLVHPDD